MKQRETQEAKELEEAINKEIQGWTSLVDKYSNEL